MGKERGVAGRVIGGLGEERGGAEGGVEGAVEAVEELIRGFAAENAAGEVRWGEWYGVGSDILHLK